MIQVTTIDKENIYYLIRNLEDFEKDKAVRSGLRAAMNVFRVKEGVIFVQGCSITGNRPII